MRIDGLPNLPRVSQSNQRSDASRQRRPVGRAGDTVEISPTAQGVADLAETAKASPERLGRARVDELRERVRSGYYNSAGVRRQIAGAMLDARGLRDVVDQVSQVRAARRRLAEVPDARFERVAQARDRAGNGFYDQPQVRRQTADRIIDELA